MELFEGMKAFRGADNKIRLFRPEKNMERMLRTAVRAALPAIFFFFFKLSLVISYIIIYEHFSAANYLDEFC